MKKKLLTLLPLLLLSSYCFANDIDPDLLKPMSYHITIENSKHKAIYETDVDNLIKFQNNNLYSEEYVDNCIKNKSIIESSKTSTNDGLTVTLLKTDDVAQDMVVEIKKLLSKSKINTGECFIEEPVFMTATLKQNLPFLIYEQKFHFKNQDGLDLNETYYLKVSGKKIK